MGMKCTRKNGLVCEVRCWNLWVLSIISTSFLKSSNESHAAAIIVSKSIASLLEVIGAGSLDRLLLRTSLEVIGVYGSLDRSLLTASLTLQLLLGPESIW